MAVVKIDYSDISAAAKRAKDAADYYEDYADGLKKKVYDKLDESKLPESDSAGNISSARSAISNRMAAMRRKKDYYAEVSTSITKMRDNFETIEGKVVKEVRKIAEDAMELKTIGTWDAICQWIYGTFCVDLANLNPITRAIGNLIKKAMDGAETLKNKIAKWFRCGGGAYIIDMITDCLDVIAAIGGAVLAVSAAIAAVVAAIAGGTVVGAVMLVIAAVAAVVVAVLKSIDMVISFTNNIKALMIIKDTNDPGQARFYGSIEDYGDLTQKRDYGDQEKNDKREKGGEIYNTTREVAGIVSAVFGAIGGAGMIAERVVDPETGKTVLKTGYDIKKVVPNLIKKTQEQLGLKKIDGKWKFSVKNLFKKKNDKYGVSEVEKLLKKNLIIDHFGSETYETISNFEKKAKSLGKIGKRIKAVDNIAGEGKSMYDRAKGTVSLIKNSNLNISKPADEIEKHVIKLIDMIKDWELITPAPSVTVPSPVGSFGGGSGGGGGGVRRQS